jgi:hypothetical protein
MKKKADDFAAKKQEKSEKRKETLKAYVIYSHILMKNPYHYANFLKLDILCRVARVHMLDKTARSKNLLAMAMSRLPYPVLEDIDDIKTKYSQDQKMNFRICALRISTIVNRFFRYNKFNDTSIWLNLIEQDSSHFTFD